MTSPVGANLDSDAYDCVPLVETLHHIFDVRRALQTTHRILARGGVLLATEPGIAQISRYDPDSLRGRAAPRSGLRAAHRDSGREALAPQHSELSRRGATVAAGWTVGCVAGAADPHAPPLGRS